jgi:hypothetical protein
MGRSRKHSYNPGKINKKKKFYRSWISIKRTNLSIESIIFYTIFFLPETHLHQIKKIRHSIYFQISNKKFNWFFNFFFLLQFSGFNPGLKTPDFGLIRSQTAYYTLLTYFFGLKSFIHYIHSFKTLKFSFVEVSLKT